MRKRKDCDLCKNLCVDHEKIFCKATGRMFSSNYAVAYPNPCCYFNKKIENDYKDEYNAFIRGIW